MRQAGRRLAAARPGVGAIAGDSWEAARVAAVTRATWSPTRSVRWSARRRRRSPKGASARRASIAIQLRERIDGATVLTHSNSATVREAFSHDDPAKVLCTVSSPVEEGRTLVAELTDAGIDAELVEDADAPDRVREADVVLVGADTVFRDGTICNKIGTIPLARGGARRRSAGRRGSRADQAGAGAGRPRSGSRRLRAGALRADPRRPDHRSRDRGRRVRARRPGFARRPRPVPPRGIRADRTPRGRTGSGN